jgi:hypothetical protein
MISINGLNEHQVNLLDSMWEFDSLEDLESWIETLTLADQEECHRLQRLLIIESMDELLKDDVSDAQDVIKQFML